MNHIEGKVRKVKVAIEFEDPSQNVEHVIETGGKIEVTLKLEHFQAVADIADSVVRRAATGDRRLLLDVLWVDRAAELRWFREIGLLGAEAGSIANAEPGSVSAEAQPAI